MRYYRPVLPSVCGLVVRERAECHCAVAFRWRFLSAVRPTLSMHRRMSSSRMLARKLCNIGGPRISLMARWSGKRQSLRRGREACAAEAAFLLSLPLASRSWVTTYRLSQRPGVKDGPTSCGLNMPATAIATQSVCRVRANYSCRSNRTSTAAIILEISFLTMLSPTIPGT